jgi:hypothetical protein
MLATRLQRAHAHMAPAGASYAGGGRLVAKPNLSHPLYLSILPEFVTLTPKRAECRWCATCEPCAAASAAWPLHLMRPADC